MTRMAQEEENVLNERVNTVTNSFKFTTRLFLQFSKAVQFPCQWSSTMFHESNEPLLLPPQLCKAFCWQGLWCVEEPAANDIKMFSFCIYRVCGCKGATWHSWHINGGGKCTLEIGTKINLFGSSTVCCRFVQGSQVQKVLFRGPSIPLTMTSGFSDLCWALHGGVDLNVEGNQLH